MNKEFIENMLKSYKNLFNTELALNIESLVNANYVCAAHKFYADSSPRFIFANQQALNLWQLSLEEFIGMPSTKTASEEHQQERDSLLNQVHLQGFIKNYSGIRQTSTGQNFKIFDALVWNVYNEKQETIGQAVKFDNYKML